MGMISMKHIILCIVAVFPAVTSAEIIEYTCNSDHDWQMNYVIDTDKKTVFFKSSGSADGTQSYVVEEFEQVLLWQNNEVSIFKRYDSNPSYRTFFIDQDLLLNTGQYSDGSFHNQVFKCVRGTTS